MRVNREALAAIEKAALEGRVTEGGKAVLPGLAPAALPLEASEKDFQQAVIDLGKRNAWRHYHTYDSRRSQPGFLDLVLVRERVVWMELKSEDGELTAEQLAWVDALRAAKQEVYVMKPKDWPQIVNILEGKS